MDKLLIVRKGEEGPWKLADVELQEGGDIVVMNLWIIEIDRRSVLVKSGLQLLNLFAGFVEGGEVDLKKWKSKESKGGGQTLD